MRFEERRKWKASGRKEGRNVQWREGRGLKNRRPESGSKSFCFCELPEIT